MARKVKRPAARALTLNPAPTPVQEEQVETAKPKAKATGTMVTWTGTGESKTWQGVRFPNGQPICIDHLPAEVIEHMKARIDGGGPGNGEWEYEG